MSNSRGDPYTHTAPESAADASHRAHERRLRPGYETARTQRSVAPRREGQRFHHHGDRAGTDGCVQSRGPVGARRMPAAPGRPTEINTGSLMRPHPSDIPSRIETERLYLRCYAEGDGSWYYTMSLQNQAHLARYES